MQTCSGTERVEQHAGAGAGVDVGWRPDCVCLDYYGQRVSDDIHCDNNGLGLCKYSTIIITTVLGTPAHPARNLIIIYYFQEIV